MIPFVYAVPMPLKLPNTTFCTALTFTYIEMSYLITSIVMINSYAVQLLSSSEW